MKDNPSFLNDRIKSVLELIWDFKKMNKMLKELNFDTEKNPLGKLQYE